MSLKQVMLGESNYRIVENRKRWFRVSWVMVAISALAIIWPGLSLSIDFTGGVVVTAPNVAGVSVAEVLTELDAAGFTQARVEELDGGAELRTRLGALDEAQELQLRQLIGSLTGADVGDITLSSVGPTFGAAVARQAIVALLVFIGMVIVFFAIRFELPMALGSISALLKDLIITFGVYALAGFDVTPATIVAILTTLGYSLYDNVVVFDIVKENETAANGRVPYAEIVNRSINQVLFRSILTLLVSLLPVGALVVTGIVMPGAASLLEFSLALFVGFFIGLYSTIFLVAPMLVSWKEWRGEDTSVPEHTGPATRKKGGTYVGPRGFESARPPGSRGQRKPPR